MSYALIRPFVHKRHAAGNQRRLLSEQSFITADVPAVNRNEPPTTCRREKYDHIEKRSIASRERLAQPKNPKTRPWAYRIRPRASTTEAKEINFVHPQGRGQFNPALCACVGVCYAVDETHRVGARSVSRRDVKPRSGFAALMCAAIAIR